MEFYYLCYAIRRPNMLGRLHIALLGLLLLSACNTYTPDVSAVCARDEIGNYVLKWETNPQMDGMVKIYASSDPTQFNTSSPVVQTDITDGIATYITEDNIASKYFLLSFNDKYTEIVGSRSVRMDSVQNLRDLGGYAAGTAGKNTRWGNVFRSGSLGSLSDRDTLRLDNLRIKTIIDLRSVEEVAASPLAYTKAKVVHLPTMLGNFNHVYEKIREGRLRKGDGILYMQDLYLQFVAENKEPFSKALEVFLDENNYPILFNCTMGKDRTGFLAALLLLMLGVSEETVVHDYMETNNYIDLQRFNSAVLHLSTEAQEALTVILTANESFLRLAIGKINKEYGSVSNYLSKELNINEKQQEKLKEIMLF